MKRRIACVTCLIVLLACPTLLLTACHTVNGLGKDIETGGKKLQHASGESSQDW